MLFNKIYKWTIEIRFNSYSSIAFFAAIIALGLVQPNLSHAATYTVNSLADTDDSICDGTNCTLREAINEANATTPTPDTIVFSVSGTITLGSTLPTITDALIINGSGQSVDVSGNDLVQVFFNDSNLKLDSITISHGNSGSGAGGGIFSSFISKLEIANCAMSSNQGMNGGAIEFRGDNLKVERTAFSNNFAADDGGALHFNNGIGTVNESTFLSNSAGSSGGAIYADHFSSDSFSVTNSTFSNNNITDVSPANFEGGGAISYDASSSSSDSFTNNTFFGNTSLQGGAIHVVTGTLTIQNSTIFGNSSDPTGGGGIRVRGSSGTAAAVLKNTIVANNTGQDCFWGVGSLLTANSYNIDSDGTCDNATQKTIAQIALGPLANNGGPTQTMALLSGSAAIDAGNNADIPLGLTTDQRGFPRIFNFIVDVGAYERNCTLDFEGFFSPVDNYPVANVSKAGQAVPLKFKVTSCGEPVTNLTAPPVKVIATTVSCSLGTTADLLEEEAAGASGLQNLGNGYYQFNWKTPKSYAGSCKEVHVDLGDGDPSHKALFQFVK